MSELFALLALLIALRFLKIHTQLLAFYME